MQFNVEILHCIEGDVARACVAFRMMARGWSDAEQKARRIAELHTIGDRIVTTISIEPFKGRHYETAPLLRYSQKNGYSGEVLHFRDTKHVGY